MTNQAKPSIDQLLGLARVVSLPLKVQFRGVTHREAVLFEGPLGWTEWSPFLEYRDEEAAEWLRAAIEFGWVEPPKALRSFIEVNATLPAVAPGQVEKVLNDFGVFKTVKIKVAESGQTIADDIARVLRVRELYPTVAIRLDANGNFSVEQAIELAKELAIADISIEYFEQPVKTIAELAEVRIKLARIGVRVAADESVRKVSDPMAVVHAGAADVLVIKAQPIGGIRNALRIDAEANLPITVSSALETSIGISMGIQMAATLPHAEYAAGLGTVALFEDDIAITPLLPKGGGFFLRRAIASEEKLERYRASEERITWWRERLERCYKLI